MVDERDGSTIGRFHIKSAVGLVEEWTFEENMLNRVLRDDGSLQRGGGL